MRRSALRSTEAIVLVLATLMLVAGCTLFPSDQPGSDTTQGTGGATQPGTIGTCPSGLEGTSVATADELVDAAASAAAGTVIVLAAGTYSGEFTLTGSGEETNGITLCGPREAVLDGGSTGDGYTLHLQDARFWTLSGFSVTGGQKGVMLDGSSNNTISGLRISDVGDEALHLRAHSTGNLLENNEISTTGLNSAAFGEGIYIGSAQSNWCSYTGCEPDRSDNNRIIGNTISATTSENIDVKEGTSGGEIRGNTFDGAGATDADSLIDIKGTNWVIADNTGIHSPVDGAQVHVITELPGSGNTFTGNTFTVAADGVAINVVGAARDANNRVACSNTVISDGSPGNAAGAAARLSNLPCVTS